MGKEKKEEVYVAGGKRGWLEVTYSGIYDLNGLINTIKSYLGNRKYFVIDVEHSEKVMPSGREIVIELQPMRNVTEYIRFGMQIKITIMRNVDVLVEEGGKKVKRSQGDIDLTIKASIRKNWKKTFPSTPSGEFLRQTYEKYISKKQLSAYEDKLHKETEGLVDEIKGVLHLFGG